LLLALWDGHEVARLEGEVGEAEELEERDFRIHGLRSRTSEFYCREIYEIFSVSLTLYSGSGSEEQQQQEPQVEDEEDAVEEDDLEREDEEELMPSNRPYMALLQSFAETAGPVAKRRRLNPEEVVSVYEEAEELEDSDSERGDDDRDENQDGLGENPKRSTKEGDLEEDALRENEDDPEDEEEPEDNDSENEDDADPFDSHFDHPSEKVTTMKIKALQQNQKTTEKSVLQGLRAVRTYPKTSEDATMDLPSPVTSLDGLNLKQKLKEPASQKVGNFNDVQRILAPLIFNYHDILFNARTHKNGESLRKLVCLHALNHSFK
jgi:U3 small nucleolar RNA-associated protein 25